MPLPILHEVPLKRNKVNMLTIDTDHLMDCHRKEDLYILMHSTCIHLSGHSTQPSCVRERENKKQKKKEGGDYMP